MEMQIMLYKGYFTYYGQDGLTKHCAAHRSWTTDYDEAIEYLELEHPDIEGLTPAGNYVKRKRK